MHLIYDNGTSNIQIWGNRESYGWEFFVYGLTENGDPRVCPSFAMACELADIDSQPILDLAPFLADPKTSEATT